MFKWHIFSSGKEFGQFVFVTLDRGCSNGVNDSLTREYLNSILSDIKNLNNIRTFYFVRLLLSFGQKDSLKVRWKTILDTYNKLYISHIYSLWQMLIEGAFRLEWLCLTFLQTWDSSQSLTRFKHRQNSWKCSDADGNNNWTRPCCLQADFAHLVGMYMYFAIPAPSLSLSAIAPVNLFWYWQRIHTHI